MKGDRFIMAKTIDCRGAACPKPVIMTKKELDAMQQGSTVSIVDNNVAVENLKKLALSLGCTSSVEVKDGFSYVTITKGKAKAAAEEGKPAAPAAAGSLIILVSSDKFGVGDDKLGATLMKSYMYALSESDRIPKTMLFVNGGVKLTTEGSDVLESLQKLNGRGVEIMSCGTCLDFYNLKEKLVVGSVTNMYSIVGKMNGASNTIKL